MKRKWTHPEEQPSSRKQWRSLNELEGNPEFDEWLAREFPQGAAEVEMDGDSRRSFMKLMGASTALAGFGVACSRPVRHLVPFNEHVEWIVPGRALYYSTIKPRLGGLGGEPLVVTTYEGRPTKVDGNRLHPDANGGSSAFTQASILNLYDQERSRGYLQSGAPSTASAFADVLAALRDERDGSGMAVLLSPTTSPVRNRLLRDLVAAKPGLTLYSYEALEPAGRSRAWNAVYGQGGVPNVSLAGAKKILSLACDFLDQEIVGDLASTEFSKGRDPEGEMNRLYMVESAFSLTGGQADHRYRVAASQVPAVTALIAGEIAKSTGDAQLAALSEPMAKKLVKGVYNAKWIKECAADFLASAGESVVVAGSRQPDVVHAMVAGINRALGAEGKFIKAYRHDLAPTRSIRSLNKAISAGEVKTLIVLNEGDFLFDAPANVKAADLLNEVETTIHVGVNQNLTARAADWHVPSTHYLESWSDNVTLSGKYSVQQPMINPLWGGVSVESFLLSLVSEESGEEAVLEKVRESAASLGAGNWSEIVRDGYSASFQLPEVAAKPAAMADRAAKLKLADLPHPEALEISLVAGSATYDGRFANNGWLQEAPDPITKLTWDNAALVSAGTAKALGVKDGDLVSFETEKAGAIQLPILVSPGHADYCVSVAVGYYGGLADGAVSEGVGFNVYPFMQTAGQSVVTGVTATKTGEKHELALTAEHYSMEGRAIAREGTKEMFDKKPEFAKKQGMDSHIPENVPAYIGPDYKDGTSPKNKIVPVIPGHEWKPDVHHQWAMTVDLNTCTGCNACVIACQAENNIPIVGKGQVIAGREMHWIRMDRYFTSPNDHEIVAARGNVKEYVKDAFAPEDEKLDTPGKRTVDDDNIEMIPQPVACQQCESAPCETVCPVNATVHTPDGLNAMAYNRCIGTRYCANNCPYKARRFNYFDYNKRPLKELYWGPLAAPEGNATTTQRFQKNPNVSVRMRGVIEKCTYCVQRINLAKAAAKRDARDSDDVQIKANSFTVACQDACSAEAIAFGNLKADGDRVNAMKENPRNYDLLSYIGTRPRTSYLARVKNPNPKMPGAELVGTTTSKMH